MNLLEAKNASTMVNSTSFINLKTWPDPLPENLIRISHISFSIRPNLEDEIPFKGVALSHPKILNFGIWLKFQKF
jgi:hypothetical protein